MTAALQTVEKLIFGMSNGEKAQVLSWVSDYSTENLPASKKINVFVAAKPASRVRGFPFGCSFGNDNWDFRMSGFCMAIRI
jgi:hypothetical protein